MMITIRRANIEDCERVYQWRNHPDVLNQSNDPTPIPFEDHQKWYAKAMEDPTNHLFIGLDDGTPQGVVRFQEGAAAIPKTVRVSVYLAPHTQGRGYGTEFLRQAIILLKAETDAQRIVATVFGDNIPSCRMLEKNDFYEYKIEFYKDLTPEKTKSE